MAEFPFAFGGAFGDDGPVNNARMMTALLPPGKLWRLIGDSFLSRLLAACADELERVEGRVRDLFNEDDPRDALELLREYERELGLGSDGTDDERQARIVAREIARQRYRPVDFQLALAPLFGQAAVDVVVIERHRTDAIAMADDREIYRFFIYRNPALPGTYYVTAAQALVDKIAASHTKGYVIESVDFKTDDAFSLTDRDILGA